MRTNFSGPRTDGRIREQNVLFVLFFHLLADSLLAVYLLKFTNICRQLGGAYICDKTKKNVISFSFCFAFVARGDAALYLGGTPWSEAVTSSRNNRKSMSDSARATITWPSSWSILNLSLSDPGDVMSYVTWPFFSMSRSRTRSRAATWPTGSLLET